MKNKLKRLLFLFSMSLLCTGLFAQQSTLISGGTATDGTASVSWSLGQVLATYYSSSTGSVSTGVQQMFEVSPVTGINDIEGVALNMSAYPNPVSETLQLEINVDNMDDDFSFKLFNTDGKLMGSGENLPARSSIGMESYSDGTFYLKVLKGQRVVKTFKIIKL